MNILMVYKAKSGNIAQAVQISFDPRTNRQIVEVKWRDEPIKEDVLEFDDFFSKFASVHVTSTCERNPDILRKMRAEFMIRNN